MPPDEQEAIAGDQPAPESEALDEGAQAGATDTPETVAETDEEKNQRELDERQKRSERASKGIQRRFDELTSEKHALHRQNEQLLAALQTIAGRGQAPQQAAAPNAAPVRGADEDYESWVSRKAEYAAEQRATRLVSERLSQMEQTQNMTRQQAQAVQVRSEFESRMSEFARSATDWNEVVANNHDIDIPNEAAAVIHTMPDGPAILYAIGKNPALASQLQGGNVVQQAMVLGQISAALKSSTPQVSNAPPPGRPVGSKPGSSSEPPTDFKAYEAWAAKHMR